MRKAESKPIPYPAGQRLPCHQGQKEESTAPKIGVSDFFIPHTYYDITGRVLPSYLLTKKGCDMVANKMTGEKGVLFTAAYVTAFERMREHIQRKQLPPGQSRPDEPQYL